MAGAPGRSRKILFGLNVDIPVGNLHFHRGIEKGQSRNIVRPILNFGFGAGTPEPVHPPLDNAQISDKGLVSYVGGNYEFFLNEFMGVGAQVDYGYHYFTGSGKSMLAANQSHSAGDQLDAFATLTFHLGY